MPTGVYPRKQEYRDAIRDGLRASKKKIGRPVGIPLSLEEKEQRRIASTGRTHTEVTRAKMSAYRIGKFFGRRRVPGEFRHSKETKRKMSEKATKREWTPEQKQRHSEKLKGTATHTSVGQKRVMERLRQEGCRVLQRGWPDILVVEPDGKIRAIEVKRPGGTLSLDQVAVFAILHSVGLDVEVLHESNKKEL